MQGAFAHMRARALSALAGERSCADDDDDDETGIKKKTKRNPPDLLPPPAQSRAIDGAGVDGARGGPLAASAARACGSQIDA